MLLQKLHSEFKFFNGQLDVTGYSEAVFMLIHGL